jgi:hypothetical protein
VRTAHGKKTRQNAISELGEAIQSVVPMAPDKRKLEAQLTFLAAVLRDFVTHGRKRRKGMDTTVPAAIARQFLGKPRSLN